MDNEAQIAQLLSLIRETAEEILSHVGEDMSAEEILVAAVESVLATPVTTIQYGSPVATVDRTQVSYMIDEEFEVPIYGGYDGED